MLGRVYIVKTKRSHCQVVPSVTRLFVKRILKLSKYYSSRVDVPVFIQGVTGPHRKMIGTIGHAERIIFFL